MDWAQVGFYGQSAGMTATMPWISNDVEPGRQASLARGARLAAGGAHLFDAEALVGGVEEHDLAGEVLGGLGVPRPAASPASLTVCQQAWMTSATPSISLPVASSASPTDHTIKHAGPS